MSDAVNDNDELLHVKSCSICGKPAEQRWRPFCSRRCADVDLHKWLSGSYAIPASPVSDDEEMDAQMIFSSQNNPVSVDN